MTATGRPRELRPRGLCVRIAPSALDGEWRNLAARLVLAQEVPGSSPGSPALPPRTAAAPPSYGGWPGPAPGGGSLALVPQAGRRTWLRTMWMRVRVPPSVHSSSFRGGLTASRPALEAGARWFESSSLNEALRIGVRSPLVWACRPGRHRGRAPCGCSSRGQSVGSPSRRSPVRSRSAARMPD